jgi:hypothetical protein
MASGSDRYTDTVVGKGAKERQGQKGEDRKMRAEKWGRKEYAGKEDGTRSKEK